MKMETINNEFLIDAVITWVDADERVTEELKSEILNLLKNPSINNFSGYWISRKNHFMGKHVRFGGWNDKVIRLFKKSECRYEDKQVHAEIIDTGKIGSLKEKLYHHTYVNFDFHMEKLNRYAWLQANDYDKKNRSFNTVPFYC